MKAPITVICIAAALILSISTVSGQQSQPFTQYLFNRFLLNPAACGADGYASVGLTIKDQWAGFVGAPTNQTLTAQTRLPREGLFGKRSSYGTSGYSPGNAGLGVALFNDIRGPIRTTGSHFTYAYHMEAPQGQLSFGLTGSFFQLYINRDKIVTELGYDRYIDANRLSSFVPEASFGVHYTTNDYYTGLSVSNLFQSFLTFGGRNSYDYRLERQYLLLGGYVLDINRQWALVPGTQLKLSERGAAQVDANVMVYYFDQFWGGFSYRSGGGGVNGGASMIFGVRHKQYYFGYAFDYSMSNMHKYSLGSHEIMVSITYGDVERFFRYRRRYEFQDSEQQYRGNTWMRRKAATSK
ncbi:MAG: type IX secretion system membrane protein PorP/SprF [Bacteroidales bacterium]|jgi:type IX secretion system PorP/SprF family membrane protein|nr:type IX secretion system membrane protein PorP/SprF [Bacteroidales bacterium]